MRISGGYYKNYRLSVPKNRTRPTSGRLRQTVFNLCRDQIRGVLFLDVFAGSGAMGIEALSWGAKHATFIDKNKGAVHTIKDNLDRLNLKSQATLFPIDALKALKLLEKKGQIFELIYIDPPYGHTFNGGATTYLDAALSLIDQTCLLAEAGTLFCETTTFPVITSLRTLCLKDERKVGASRLLQFKATGVSVQSQSSRSQAHSPA